MEWEVNIVYCKIVGGSLWLVVYYIRMDWTELYSRCNDERISEAEVN